MKSKTEFIKFLHKNPDIKAYLQSLDNKDGQQDIDAAYEHYTTLVKNSSDKKIPVKKHLEPFIPQILGFSIGPALPFIISHGMLVSCSLVALNLVLLSTLFAASGALHNAKKPSKEQQAIKLLQNRAKKMKI